VNRKGFALVAAVWLLVALSVVGLDLSLRGRARRLAAANANEALQARAAAGAGVSHARALLEERATMLHTAGIDPWQGIAPLPEQSVPGASYRVQLRDAGAGLNLNRCTEEELRRLLQALRIDAGEADRIAQAAMDWRDADGMRRARGAEADDYVRAGAPVAPRNAMFTSVGEMRYVRGVTDRAFRRMEPFLTVAGTGTVNLATAPREVLLALPGIGEEAATALLRRRRAGAPLGSITDLAEELSFNARALLIREMPALLSRTSLETREIEVRAEGWAQGGRIRAREEALAVRSGTAVFVVGRRSE
jgi:type II secretory pathway component PulK